MTSRLVTRWSRLAAVDERPPPDPTKLLVAWMEWERGDTPPGRVMSNLKIAGMREFLEATAEAQADLAATADLL